MNINQCPCVFSTKTNSIVDFVRDETPEEAIARLTADYGADLIVLPTGEAWQRHQDAFKTEPVEVTAERFHEMLNVLPPEDWRRDDRGQSFKMMERTTGAITAIYVETGGRHFTFSDRFNIPHAECIARVRSSPAFATLAEQEFTVTRYYRGIERFTVRASTPEQAVERLELEGPETAHVSERDGDEYDAVLGHQVYGESGTPLLNTFADTTALSGVLTVGFTITRDGDEFYFTATHKSAAGKHGPYASADELVDVLRDYIAMDVVGLFSAEDIDETLFAKAKDGGGGR